MVAEQSKKNKIFPNGMTWDGEDAGRLKRRWLIEFSARALVEFKERVRGLNLNNAFLQSYKKEDLSFPELEKLSRPLKLELQKGMGFILLRDYQKVLLNEQELRFLYLIMCLEFGKLNTRYGRLYDVRDRGKNHKTQRVPVSQTKASTNFHTDSTAANYFPDIVGLLCINQAKEGGESLLVNALQVHEQLRNQAPECLKFLYKDFIRDIITPGEAMYAEALRKNAFPVFSNGKYTEGISFRYMRYWMERGAENANASLSPKDLEMLDRLDELLDDEKNQVQFRMERGDMLFVNNHTVAHNRRAYLDYQEAEKKRLLVRTWIDVV